MKNLNLKKITKIAEHFQINLIFTIITSHALHYFFSNII